MSSSKVLANLNIRKYPSYESYKASTPGEDDLCVVDENGDLLLQVQTLPIASATYEGRIVQQKSNGYFYKCVSDGQDPATYSWTQQEVQPQQSIPDSLEQWYDLSVTGSVGKIVQYTGATDANYTNGYVYKVVNVPATATISQTVGSSLSDLTVDADGFISNISGYATGTYVLTYTNGVWYYGSAEYDISTYITYTGTPEEGDEITVEVLTLPTTAWQQCDVQPAGSSLPDQTGNNGKFLTTDGTNASWATVVGLKNAATFWSSLAIQTESGYGADVTSAMDVIAIGAFANASASSAIAIGPGAKATAAHAIMISSDERGVFRTNSDANTFKVANANGNFEIMSADGTIPEARLADTTSAQQGDVLTLDSTGNAVWQASSGGGLPSQTGNAGKFLTTDGTDASWGNALVNNVNSEYALGLLKSATASSNGVAIGWSANSTGGVSIGQSSKSSSGVGIGPSAKANASYSIAVGQNAQVGNSATGAIQFNTAGGTTYTNNDANTFKVANANDNFEIMNANGNLPADRLASTTGLADGNYRLRCTITNGVPTLSWVAE